MFYKVDQATEKSYIKGEGLRYCGTKILSLQNFQEGIISYENFFSSKKIIDIIVESQKGFEKNLKNKKLMFIYENLTQVHKIGKKWSYFLIHLYCLIFFFSYFYLQFYFKYIYITLRHPACFCIPVSFLFSPRYKSYNINSHTNFLSTLLKQHFCSHLLPI